MLKIGLIEWRVMIFLVNSGKVFFLFVIIINDKVMYDFVFFVEVSLVVGWLVVLVFFMWFYL